MLPQLVVSMHILMGQVKIPMNCFHYLILQSVAEQTKLSEQKMPQF